VASAWAGCIDGGGGKADATLDESPGAGGNATAAKPLTVPVRVVPLPLGKGELTRQFRDPQTIPDPLDLFDTRSTRYTLNISDVWPASDLRYQVWLVDEQANTSLRSPLFDVSKEGWRQNFRFEFERMHATTYNTVFVTLEPRNDDRRGFAVLRGVFASGQATSVSLEPAGSLSEVVSQGMLSVGGGDFSLTFAATGIPLVQDLRYDVWLELGEERKRLGEFERDEEADSWGFGAIGTTALPSDAFVETARFAVTLEPSSKSQERSSGAVVMRLMGSGR